MDLKGVEFYLMNGYDNISVHISENVSSKTTLNVIFTKNNWQLTQWQIIYATADVTS